MSRKTVNLAEVIKANPGCVAIVDNDCWHLYRRPPGENPHDTGDDGDDFDAIDKWEAENELANDGDKFEPRLGDGGYGSGSCYGGDILQALAQIVGIKVESV